MSDYAPSKAGRSVVIGGADTRQKTRPEKRRWQNSSQSVDIPSISYSQKEDKRL